MKLGRMKDGRYFKNVGYLEGAGQPKFYLGRNPAEALIRAGRIERVWQWHAECFRWSDVERPYWYGYPLDLARAIAEGRPIEHVPESWAKWVAELGVATTDQQALASGLIQTFHQAVGDYVKDVQAKFPTLWGSARVRLIEFVRERVTDFGLKDFDAAKIESVIHLLASRPVSRKTGRPVSVSWSRNTIKEFRRFIRWLHKSKEYRWSRPADYDVSPVRVARTQGERARITALAVEVFTADELATLWRYGLPWDRLLMTLALNGGFGMAEIATLRPEEVLFDQPHPAARRIGLDPPDVPACWIRRLRGKTDVYGEWKLWDVTVAALRWIMRNRPHPEWVVTTKAGQFLHPQGKRNNLIANSWTRLLARVRKDHPRFPARSFNKLRKTAINLLRQAAGEELASLFAAHGRPVHDDLIRVYANPRWASLHRATDGVREHLAPVFDPVPEPFPAGEVRGGPNLSLKTIEEIGRLAREGFKPGEIGVRAGVSRETARRWAKRATKAAGESPEESGR